MIRILILLFAISLSSCGGETKEEVQPIVKVTWEQKLSNLVVNKLSIDNNKVALAE